VQNLSFFYFALPAAAQNENQQSWIMDLIKKKQDFHDQ
jgi:hypothetical protein